MKWLALMMALVACSSGQSERVDASPAASSQGVEELPGEHLHPPLAGTGAAPGAPDELLGDAAESLDAGADFGGFDALAPDANFSFAADAGTSGDSGAPEAGVDSGPAVVFLECMRKPFESCCRDGGERLGCAPDGFCQCWFSGEQSRLQGEFDYWCAGVTHYSEGRCDSVELVQ